MPERKKGIVFPVFIRQTLRRIVENVTMEDWRESRWLGDVGTYQQWVNEHWLQMPPWQRTFLRCIYHQTSSFFRRADQSMMQEIVDGFKTSDE